jgi:hypothetical protein
MSPIDTAADQGSSKAPATTSRQAAMGKVFTETFDQPRRGWITYPEPTGASPLEVRDGAGVTRSPWWLDPNHAPPGGGYLHILFVLHTYHWPGWREKFDPAFGPNPLVEGGYPTDYRHAKVTCRLKGRLEARGASLVLLAQAKLKSSGMWVNQVLAAQPFQVTPDWTEQTIELVPDQRQWVQLGSRHDCTATYAEGPIEELLADLNGDFILVLFPLDVRPTEPFEGDFHRLRAGAPLSEGGIAIDRGRLPTGEVWLDTFRIEFA